MKKIIAILTLICFTACSHYRAQPLPVAQLTSKKLSVHFQPLDEQDSKTYLGAKLQNYDIQPILVTIQNPTNKAYYFEKDNFSLPTNTPDQIAEKIAERDSSGTLIRGIGVGGSALAGAATISIPVVSLFWMGPLGIPITAAWGLFCAIPYAISNSIANGIEGDIDSVKNDYLQKELRNQSIPPHTATSGILFVPKDLYTPTFSLILKTNTLKPIHFTYIAPLPNTPDQLS